MHRMYKWFLTAAAVCLMGTSAVASAEIPTTSNCPPKGITSSRKISVNVPDENPVVDGVNPLTGESWYGNYYPILVNIDAHPEACRTGASPPPIFPMKCRFRATVPPVPPCSSLGTIPSYAGPVRSARVPMGNLREIWDSAWVFYGWQNWAKGPNLVVDVDDWALSVHSDARQKSWVFPFVEGTERNYSDLFRRENDGEHVAPHNVQIDERRRLPVHQRIDQAPVRSPRPALTAAWTFPPSPSTTKTTTPAYVSSYEYNEMTGLYERYRNGSPYYDALTGAQNGIRQRDRAPHRC